MSGQWLDDGSATISGDGPVVSCSADPQGDNVFHALWTGDGSVSSGVHYWEVENRGGLGGVGLTTQSKFGKGYACRSFNFNAINLSDGGALLVGEYGPGEFHVGDTIGLLCEFVAAHLTITFFVNGRCLGPAFQVGSPYPTELYPVITFKRGGSSASIKKVSTVPQGRAREPEPAPFPEGHWSLLAHPTVTLDVRARHGALSAGLHVINRCNFQLQQKDGAWHAGPGMSTRMAGPPELMQLERECCAKIEALTNVSQQDGKLLISGPAGDLVFGVAVKELPIPHVGNVLER